MSLIKLELDDDFQKRFTKFSEVMQIRMLWRIGYKVGSEFRSFVRKNYVRGQTIGRRTGQLSKGIALKKKKSRELDLAVVPYMRLANIYHDPEGATIYPKNGKALKWETKDGQTIFAKRVHLPSKPWMFEADNNFNWDSSIDRISFWQIEKEWEKQGLS